MNSSCVPEAQNLNGPVIELEGATTEEIEEGSFVSLSIEYSAENSYRDELFFLPIEENSTEFDWPVITITIDPKGQVITSPSLVLPDNFAFKPSFANPNDFSSLEGTCGRIISQPCFVNLWYLPDNNFRNVQEILFHYVYQKKGFRSRLPINIKAVGKLDVNNLFGPISNGPGNNMCGIGIGGSIKCWGNPIHGNLGITDKYTYWGDTSDELGDLIPTYELEEDVKKIEMVKDFGCIQFNNNQLKCFGKNNDGALGRDNSRPINPQVLSQVTPINFPDDLSLIEFSIGDGHVCGLFSKNGNPNNEINCWGRNDKGQLGVGDFDDRDLPLGYGVFFNNFALNLLAAQIRYPVKITQVVSNKHSNCALFQDGNVKCWGDNSYGQLGLEDKVTRGNNSTTGTLFDVNDLTNPHTLIDLGTGITALKLYGGEGEHFCAKISETEMKCWGKNDQGQLGLNDVNNRGDAPNEMGDNLGRVTVPAGFKIKDVSLGTGQTCVHMEDDSKTGAESQSLLCFGAGTQIGSGSNQNLGDNVGEMAALQAVQLGDDFEIKSIHSRGKSTCVISADKKIKCFGDNTYGQLGIGSTNTIGDSSFEMNNSLQTLNLPVFTEISFLAMSSHNTCFILDKRKMGCLGDNSNGFVNSSRGTTLGTDPGTSGAANAALPLGNDPATQISVGYDHACAVFNTASGSQVKCWGRNDYGQLGYENRNNLIDLPSEQSEIPYVDLGEFVTVESVHAGKHFTCAVVYEFGDPDFPVAAGSVWPGSPTNRIKCWGRSDFGQLGLETTSNIGDQPGEMGDDLPYVNLGETTAAEVGDPTYPFTIVDFDSGLNHSCAVINIDPTSRESSRRIKCWGKNDTAQLGQGGSSTQGDRPGTMGNALQFTNLGPVAAPLTDFQEIKLGHDFSCARRKASIYCWGKNHKGQLATGNTNTIGDNGNEMDENIQPVRLSFSSSLQAPIYNRFNQNHVIDTRNTDYLNYYLSNDIPVPINNIRSQWTVGADHVCVMTNSASKDIYCWGDGDNLGTNFGENVGDLSPYLIGNSFTQGKSNAALLGITSQAESTCIYYSDGMAKCWGKGPYLGNGRNHDQGNYYREIFNLTPLIFPFLWF